MGVETTHSRALFPKITRFSIPPPGNSRLSLANRDFDSSGAHAALHCRRRLLRRLHAGIDEAAGLAPPQRGVVAAMAQQLVVRALLDDAAVVEHDQPVH